MEIVKDVGISEQVNEYLGAYLLSQIKSSGNWNDMYSGEHFFLNPIL